MLYPVLRIFLRMYHKEKNHIVIGTDVNYVHKAVIYYESLYRYYKNFILHVFCFDEVAHKAFSCLNYPNVVIYHTSEFETRKLLNIKKTKEKLYEYYWAINAYISKFVLDKYQPSSVTFSDCDCMFFKSPQAIFDEAEGADILIQPNNFSFQSVKDFIPVGYYCSSFEYFRNNKNGRKVINWWNRQCLKWCSASFEDGRFGDQKYLDGWKIKFNGVREIANPGANVAPWNVQKYDLNESKKEILLNNKWPLIYYHYHSFRMNLLDYQHVITGDRENYYQISNDVIRLIYNPYIERMKITLKKLKNIKEYRDYVNKNPKGIPLDSLGNTVKKYSHSS